MIGQTYGDSEPVFFNDNKTYNTNTLSLKGAYLISSLWQFGLEASFLSKDNTYNSTAESNSSLADTSLSLTFELFPEEYFSVWKPRVFIFVRQLFPTGKSNYESDSELLSDVSGKGHYITSSGLILSKVYRSIDWQLFFEYKYLYKTKVNQMEIAGHTGFTTGGSLGLSPAGTNFRLGVGITNFYFDSKEILIKNQKQASSEEQYWDSSFTVNYLHKDSTYSLTYTDQTLLGPSQNTTLSRTISLSWLERWPL
ncbi:hypothetical protein A9Q84_03665 [Halobacteriovorax marinus]|uniref:Outer membrane protein beta-barrel domain-containing protein n=1 Tax=Halobacteriovorax marinus TaxID=97084 RepID=A0A1Y5FA14_9BACT|nr:hypothetical protein A9Q84_03665 [Halobacteriovorax marinus]